MEFTGERFIPIDTIDVRLAQEHWHRYLWAAGFVENKKVLDIACGEGFGSDYLAKTAKEVMGCDISEESIAHAQNKYKKDNVSFKVMSVDNLELDSDSFDIIVSFETIEHIGESAQEKAVKEFARVLNKDGILCITTPGTDSPRHFAGNEFHIKECSYDEFHKLLSDNFKYVKIMGQSVYSSSVIGDCKNEVKTINTEFPNFDTQADYDLRADKYLIALCSNEPIDKYKTNSILIDRKFVEPVCNTELESTQNFKRVSVSTLFKIFIYSVFEKITSKEKYRRKIVRYIGKLK